MNVTVFSDIHLEFSPMDPGTGDVLILAGDICTAYELGTGSDLDKRYQEFFAKCVAGYNKVFYTLGNHEHYYGVWELNERKIRENIPSEISVLLNQSEYYNGWHFVGTTLWADFNNQNPVMMQTVALSMNDYHQVIKMDGTPLQPRDTLAAHDETVAWLKQVLPTLRGNVFVFSHHAPSKCSNKGGYAHSDVSGAYCSDLSHIIEMNPHIKYWVHGHLHESVDYEIGSTNIISNPRGYVPYNPNADFNPGYQLTLETVGDKIEG